MKQIIFLLMFCLCQAASAASSDFEKFKTIHSQIMTYFQEFPKWESRVKEILDKNHVLDGRDMDQLNSEAVKRLSLTEEAFNFIDDHDELTHRWNLIRRRNGSAEVSSEELKSTMMSLALAFSLYDTFYYAYYKIAANSRLVAVMSEDNQSYNKSRRQVLKPLRKAYSLRVRLKMSRALDYYKLYYIPNALKYNSDPEFINLHEVIQSTYTYSHFGGMNGTKKFKDILHVMKGRFDLSLRISKMVLKFVGNQIFNYGSQAFGNGMGLLQSRRGKLYHREDFVTEASRELRPLDVILEKTPFRTTDKLIPGYWGHAAIYVGNADQLKELGIWNHPLVIKYQKKILNGATIIEALRPGVQINSVTHFSDIDDFLVMRYNSKLTLEEKRDHIIRAFSQIGKLYDFNFDVETGAKIVCSELVYVTFTNVHFSTSKILGRQSLSVDQVAEQAFRGFVYKVVDMWIDGKRIVDKTQESFDAIMLTKGQMTAGP